MFPRRSGLVRLLGGLSLALLVAYAWISSPLDNPSLSPTTPVAPPLVVVREVEDVKRNTLQLRRLEADVGVIAPNISAVKSVNGTGNHSLHDMTLLKVNMSGLADIVNSANQSARVERLWDDPKVLNPHPFKYLINSPKLCANQPVFLVIYVHTATGNYKRRMVIRQTWANQRYFPDTNLRLVFVCGRADDKKVPSAQEALEFEAEQYGDIVQEDFNDSYHNLTFKGIAALKWISLHCRHAKYVLKTDDDIFVNMFTLLRHLKSLDLHGMDKRGLLMCLVWNHMKVMREGKWAISKAEWSEDYYPTYCSGSAFTMSMDVAIALHNVSYQVPFFWVDDFYITGLLPLKLGNVKHKQFMSTYVLNGKQLEEKFTGPQWFTYVFSHVHDLNSIQSVWTKLVRLANGDTKAEIKFALPGELGALAAEADAREKKEALLKKKKP